MSGWKIGTLASGSCDATSARCGATAMPSPGAFIASTRMCCKTCSCHRSTCSNMRNGVVAILADDFYQRLGLFSPLLRCQLAYARSLWSIQGGPPSARPRPDLAFHQRRLNRQSAIWRLKFFRDKTRDETIKTADPAVPQGRERRAAGVDRYGQGAGVAGHGVFHTAAGGSGISTSSRKCAASSSRIGRGSSISSWHERRSNFWRREACGSSSRCSPRMTKTASLDQIEHPFRQAAAADR
jgi:hypothetical protein